jgi:hypothetical protein
MIDLNGTYWQINAEGNDLSGKRIDFKENGEANLKKIDYDENRRPIFTITSSGTFDIADDRIIIKFDDDELHGIIVEDVIFGEIVSSNPKIEFELQCYGFYVPPGNKYIRDFNEVSVGEGDEFDLILDIYRLIKDYRLEFFDGSRISRSKIKNWVDQFDEDLRIPILTELKNIFEKRYCSKKDVKDFLDSVINKLTQDFQFNNPQDFLRNSNFLNLQPAGKSQGIMLNLLNELIQEKYELSINDCGTSSKKYSIYLDDILCTGLTLISDIKDWSEQSFSEGKTNMQAIADNSTTLVFAYVFIHKKNYLKKVAEMRHKISYEISSKHKMYRLVEIENSVSVGSKIDLVLPLDEEQTERVKEYQTEISNRVDQRAEEKGWKTGPDEFYRPANTPDNEEFFTSPENRQVIENVFLHKGIQILDNANSQIHNIRALGYSLPSLKDFGFGALCFTWRNVPNNAPLVFWYSGGGFTPLFNVVRRNNAAVDFNIIANPTTLEDDLPF